MIAHVKTGSTVRSPELRIKACQSRLLEVGSDLCRLPKIFEERIERKKKKLCEVNVAYSRMYFHIKNIFALFSLLRSLLESHRCNFLMKFLKTYMLSILLHMHCILVDKKV